MMNMSFEAFLFLLLAVSVLTGLFTEAIKKALTEVNCNYHANILAGAVAVTLSAALGAGYMVVMDIQASGKTTVFLAALAVLSWLSAMIGYDKVIQAVSQFKTFPFGQGAEADSTERSKE